MGDMCQKEVQTEVPEPAQDEASATAAGPSESGVFSYRVDGELLKFEGDGFEWTRENSETGEEYLVSGTYKKVDGGIQLIISTLHKRSEGKETFRQWKSWAKV